MSYVQRFLVPFATFAVLLALSGCDSSELTGTNSSNDTGTTPSDNRSASMTMMDDFESQDLIAGQNTKVGFVDVEKNNGDVKVTYNVTSAGWCITEWHLQVSDEVEDIPTNPAGNPQPGQFEFSGTEDCATTVSQDVDIEGFDSPLFVAAHAVVEGKSSKKESDYIFGVTNDEGEIYQVNVPNESSTLFFDTGIDNVNPNWPNGLAFDESTDRLYYVGNSTDNTLYFIDTNNPEKGATKAGTINRQNAGADIHNGSYYYIPHFGPDDLHRVDFDASGEITKDEIVAEDFAGGTEFAFGDLAAKDDLLYLHGEQFDGDSPLHIEFSTINLNDYSYTRIETSEYDEEDGYTGTYVAKLQLAFGDNGTLYGHQTFQTDRQRNAEGAFFTIDLNTGELTPINSEEATIDGLVFNDMSSAPLPSLPEGEETAWAFGERFVEQGNWATYFEWTYSYEE